jgi:hypothetical protein
VVAARAIGVGLSASHATTAGVGGFSLVAVLVCVADEHPAIYAGTRTLEAGVVGLYGVVAMLSGWVRGRLLIVHSSLLYLWAGLRGVPPPAGPFLCPTNTSIHVLHALYN